MEPVSRRICKNTEDRNSKFVELFLFVSMAMKMHEDRIVGMYPPGCMHPMLDVLTVNHSMDRCSCHLFGLLVWIGVAAIHLDYSSVDVAV